MYLRTHTYTHAVIIKDTEVINLRAGGMHRLRGEKEKVGNNGTVL